MKLNLNFRSFKNNFLKKKNQIIFTKKKCNTYSYVENLFKYILAKHNSFIFESVEKGKIRGRYTIVGYNADKIWDLKNKLKVTNNGKIKTYKVKPLNYLNKLIRILIL